MMKRAAIFALAMGLLAVAWADAAPTVASTAAPTNVPTAAPTAVPTAAPSPVPTLGLSSEQRHAVAAPVSPAAWSDHGLEYRASLSNLSLFNGAPLAYCPLEIGWRFANGVRVRTGLDLFYYEGQDADPNTTATPAPNVLNSYSMQDWRTTLAYLVPLPLPVRPLVGVSMEFLWGSRQAAVPPTTGTNNSTGAWSGLGPGGVLGLEWRTSDHWALSTVARYVLPFGAQGFAAVDLGFNYLF